MNQKKKDTTIECNKTNKRDLDLSALVFLLLFFFFGRLGDWGYHFLNQYVNNDGILVVLGGWEIARGENFMDGFKYVGGPLVGAVILFGLQRVKFRNFDKLHLFRKILIIIVIVLIVIAQIAFISHSENILCK